MGQPNTRCLSEHERNGVLAIWAANQRYVSDKAKTYRFTSEEQAALWREVVGSMLSALYETETPFRLPRFLHLTRITTQKLFILFLENRGSRRDGME